MATLTNAGRIGFAKSLMASILAAPQSALIAVGTGQDWWGAEISDVSTPDIQDKIATTRIINRNKPILLRSTDGLTTFTPGDDYTISPSGSIFRAAGGAITSETPVLVSYTAQTPTPAATATELENEVGRCLVTGTSYVQLLAPNSVEQGDIALGTARYEITETPTRLILMRGRLNADEAAGDDIKEYGLFTGCEVSNSVADGAAFFPPTDIANPGEMLVADFFAPVPHDGTIGLDISVIVEI